MSDTPAPPWYRELNRYHWWVLIVCILGWLFDTMDQRIFNLARGEAMADLVSDASLRDSAGRAATMYFIFGWATGGIIFGILGDRWGRARTMLLTILIYAIFTALSGFAQNTLQFNVLRFLTGLGVGGEFSAGVALLAEVIPPRPRPYALAFMQALSAVGNILGSLVGMTVAYFGADWRWLFYVGALPALLVVAVRRHMKEPETWVEAKARSEDPGGKAMGSYSDLFSHPRWRRNALIGVTISIVGVTGVWGIGFYTPELINRTLGDQLTPEQLRSARAKMMMFQDIGAFFSMYGFGVLAARIGRRATFQIACLAAFSSIALVFGYLSDPSQIWWMGILLGFGTLSLFGGYAIYFPELFPTRLRSTGVSFCYNVGRYMAAVLQRTFPLFIFATYRDFGWAELPSYRAASITLAGIYFVGIVLMFFAPETKGKPLPEEDDAPSPAPAPAAAS